MGIGDEDFSRQPAVVAVNERIGLAGFTGLIGLARGLVEHKQTRLALGIWHSQIKQTPSSIEGSVHAHVTAPSGSQGFLVVVSDSEVFDSEGFVGANI